MSEALAPGEILRAEELAHLGSSLIERNIGSYVNGFGTFGTFLGIAHFEFPPPFSRPS
jgi:hypothetical protein